MKDRTGYKNVGHVIVTDQNKLIQPNTGRYINLVLNVEVMD
jgi:hypothetical protein